MSDNEEFYVPLRYDPTVADEGQWFSIHDTTGTLYGDFKLRFYDRTTLAYELAVKRARQRHIKKINSKELNEWDYGRISIVELHLLDWKNLPVNPKVADAAIAAAKSEAKKEKTVFGKEEEKALIDSLRKPFSTANAHAYFDMEATRWIMNELSSLVGDPANFKGQEDDSEDVVGN